MEFLTEIVREICQDLRVDLQTGLLHLIKQRGQRQLNFGIDRFQLVLENALA
jgi:hypothetical protein